jgi:hypothetical protein
MVCHLFHLLHVPPFFLKKPACLEQAAVCWGKTSPTHSGGLIASCTFHFGNVVLFIVHHLIIVVTSISMKLYFRDSITHGPKVVTRQWCLLERIFIEYSRVPPKDVQGSDE